MILGNLNYDQVLEGRVHTDVMPIMRRAALKYLEQSNTYDKLNTVHLLSSKMRMIELGMLK